MKTLIWLGLTIGGTLGGWLGSLISSGNWFSWQSIVGTTLGSFLGIYAGYKLGQNI
ncbi:MAG TPA: glycine zipper 2TM domain-containing protein [Candidatus Saccharimonadales bacterium]|nr:glycine zipper 2TM domain-containing protein [Candidatus Saccharimonadales bacterium]